MIKPRTKAAHRKPRVVRYATLPYEEATQIAVAGALELRLTDGWWSTHFPSGEYRSKRAGAKLKKMGLKKGFADFLLISPLGLHHWLELKRGNATLRVEQVAFRDFCLGASIPWALARDFDVALDILTRWGALTGLRVSA